MKPLTVPRRVFVALAILFRLAHLPSPRMHGDERDFCDAAARHRGGQRWTADAEIDGYLARGED